MTKILVTGASGFIGKALVQRLQSASYDVIQLSLKEGDIAEPRTLSKYANIKLLRVFHLAGRAYVPDSWSSPQDFYKTNALGTANVLELCRRSRTPITFISAYLYGKPEKLPISENSPVRPNNPYALSKHLAECLCDFYHTSYGLPITVLRPFNAYGIGQNEKFLIPTILRQALFEPEITVNDLTPRRDFVYLNDLVDSLIMTLGCENGYRVYNIGSGKSFSVKEVIEIAQSNAHTNKEIISCQIKRSNEIDDVVADISKAKLELKWHPSHSFHDGIKEIISAMRG